ncbi:hypothetical protein C0Z16_33365 [Paraburkholderia rhynchosiae]|uniref:Uncharacterized protein n=1 Tax=Paraburkholderia rhynchosiae TaxID=487049 RepID=A0ABX4UUP2_9BURK|nr:hypothetical protein C0Z16_33365 [Paraburkholderia rhynchosiae]
MTKPSPREPSVNNGAPLATAAPRHPSVTSDQSATPHGLRFRHVQNRCDRDWRDISGRAELQRVGTTWSQTRVSAVLAVPSAVVSADTNYLLNPA